MMTYAKLLWLASASTFALGGCAIDTGMFGQGSDAELSSYDQRFEPQPYEAPGEADTADPSSDQGQDPAYEQWKTAGDAECESLGFYGAELLRIDELAGGNYALPGATLTLSTDGLELGFESSAAVRAVLVSGGGQSNVYAYTANVYAHTGLFAPDSVPYGVPTTIDHVIFCGQ